MKINDVAIIGGGIIGVATAYFLTKVGLKVQVYERDSQYKFSSFNRSCGGFRHQFAQPENMILGAFGYDFIKKELDIRTTDNGYLMLFNEEQADEQIDTITMQRELGLDTKLAGPKELKEKFSWINLENISIASYTDTGIEGWADPWLIHTAFKEKANVDFIDQNITSLDQIDAEIIIITAGCWTSELLDLPIKPQKHSVFNVKCPIFVENMPLVADFTTGCYWRPESGGYIAGSPQSAFDVVELEPDWLDFDEYVWPGMAKRAKMFEELKLTGGWAGFYDTNTMDNNAIVGKVSDNIYVATGFTGRGLMQAPGIGRGLMELITTGEYQTIDLSCFGLERIYSKEKRIEPYVI